MQSAHKKGSVIGLMNTKISGTLGIYLYMKEYTFVRIVKNSSLKKVS